MQTETKNQFEIKAYTPKELRGIYGVPFRTFKKWLEKYSEELGEPLGGFYNAWQVKFIIGKIGVPSKIDV